MSEVTVILASVLGTLIAIFSGWIKVYTSEHPEAFNKDKALRTVLIAIFYTVAKFVVLQLGVDLNVDILLQGFIDSGLIAICERILLSLWRKWIDV